LAGLSEEARKLALDRFRLLRPHLEENQSLRSVALAAGIPYRTAHRWAAQYRQFGLAALARKKRDVPETFTSFSSMSLLDDLPQAAGTGSATPLPADNGSLVGCIVETGYP